MSCLSTTRPCSLPYLYRCCTPMPSLCIDGWLSLRRLCSTLRMSVRLLLDGSRPSAATTRSFMMSRFFVNRSLSCAEGPSAITPRVALTSRVLALRTARGSSTASSRAACDRSAVLERSSSRYSSVRSLVPFTAASRSSSCEAGSLDPAPLSCSSSRAWTKLRRRSEARSSKILGFFCASIASSTFSAVARNSACAWVSAFLSSAAIALELPRVLPLSASIVLASWPSTRVASARSASLALASSIILSASRCSTSVTFLARSLIAGSAIASAFDMPSPSTSSLSARSRSFIAAFARSTESATRRCTSSTGSFDACENDSSRRVAEGDPLARANLSPSHGEPTLVTFCMSLSVAGDRAEGSAPDAVSMSALTRLIALCSLDPRPLPLPCSATSLAASVMLAAASRIALGICRAISRAACCAVSVSAGRLARYLSSWARVSSTARSSSFACCIGSTLLAGLVTSCTLCRNRRSRSDLTLSKKLSPRGDTSFCTTAANFRNRSFRSTSAASSPLPIGSLRVASGLVSAASLAISTSPFLMLRCALSAALRRRVGSLARRAPTASAMSFTAGRARSMASCSAVAVVAPSASVLAMSATAASATAERSTASASLTCSSDGLIPSRFASSARRSSAVLSCTGAKASPTSWRSCFCICSTSAVLSGGRSQSAVSISAATLPSWFISRSSRPSSGPLVTTSDAATIKLLLTLLPTAGIAPASLRTTASLRAAASGSPRENSVRACRAVCACSASCLISLSISIGVSIATPLRFSVAPATLLSWPRS
eukprot:Unigene4967_Nuclearia_a/m.15196 Unigene4967_Nuclearia_a/g.15196  ORF Unigene4967_Nuclearia_a/g.15196 Unigene4967_Nuclearia_a/m.15196 type:complete len:778 (-) Unigene4967_Nuclearia_a:2606-4939(-)